MTEQTSPTLTILGAPDASACEGDSCLIPGADGAVHQEHAIVARRIDDDLV